VTTSSGTGTSAGTSKVRLEAEGGRRVLTLDDPDRRNALDARMRQDLADAITAVAADADARVLVVTGAGTAFCAGADLPAVFGGEERPVADVRRDLHEVYDSFLRMLELPIPTIAAVQGPAVGAGLNLAMACDVRVAGPKAEFAATFTQIGLHPGGGCTSFLVRALGPQRALALLLDGGAVSGPESVAAGLAVAVEDDPLAAAVAMADRWAALEPELVRDVKRSVQIAARGDFQASLEFESWAQASSAHSPRLREFVARFR
jgi:enoyl-CoA hydratase